MTEKNKIENSENKSLTMQDLFKEAKAIRIPD